MTRNLRDFAAIQDEQFARLARKRLEAFVQWVWPILEPETPFLPNWHLGLICEYLEAVTAGQIHQLVINLPPRHGKSLLVSVLWPVWEWIRRPSGRWLFASHSDALALRLSLDRRRVLLDPIFRQHFSHVRLMSDQHAKAEFHNTRRGAMIATSMGGSITGKGGDRLVIDDPHSPEQVESDVQRQQAIDRFRISLSTRLNDKRHGATVLVMQRLHTRDLSGVCLELGFEHLCLEAIASTRKTVVFPRSGRRVTREVDDVLWPAREDRAALDQVGTTLGPYAFAGQYLQQPVPRAGGLFPRDRWVYEHECPDGEGAQILQSWDLTFKDGDGSDYVVGLVAARVGALVYLLDRFKAKASFVDTVRAIRAMHARYPRTSAVLIEEAANGPAVIDSLRAEIPGIVPVNPCGGKVSRAHSVQAVFEAGQVILPNPIALSGEARPDRWWVSDFVGVCAAFPKGAHDDDVDALTQLLVWCGQHRVIAPVAIAVEAAPVFVRRLNMFPEDRAPHAREGRLTQRFGGRFA